MSRRGRGRGPVVPSVVGSSQIRSSPDSSRRRMRLQSIKTPSESRYSAAPFYPLSLLTLTSRWKTRSRRKKSSSDSSRKKMRPRWGASHQPLTGPQARRIVAEQLKQKLAYEEEQRRLQEKEENARREAEEKAKQAQVSLGGVGGTRCCCYAWDTLHRVLTVGNRRSVDLWRRRARKQKRSERRRSRRRLCDTSPRFDPAERGKGQGQGRAAATAVPRPARGRAGGIISDWPI